MKSIFINYRREDSFAHTKNIYEKLVRSFGKDKIFMDIPNVTIGEDFIDIISKTLSSCSVLLVIIGNKWLDTLSQRLIDNAEDYVRDEIKIALTKQLYIIPVLVDGAPRPRNEQLPEDIRPLARHNIHEISHSRYDYDVKKLLKELRRICLQGRASQINLLVAGIDLVKEWKWDNKQFMDKCLSMDRDLMDGLTIEEEGTPEQWGPIAWGHPDTWRILVTSPDQPGSIVGNWQFVPLFESDYEAARQGRLNDNEITADKIKPLLPGWYDIYFVAIVMLPEFRKIPYLHCLVNSVLDHFTYLAQRGIFINRICANAYTPEGEALCRYFEFDFKEHHQVHGKIYERTLFPFPDSPLFRDYKELERLYEKAIKSHT